MHSEKVVSLGTHLNDMISGPNAQILDANSTEASRDVPSFRMDRALTVRVLHPVCRLLNGWRSPGVPILMYHGISDQLGDRHPYFETNTAPRVFAQQMRFLRERGYVTVDLPKALNTLTSGRTSEKRVAITFDDGYRDFFTHACPILAECGFTATMFVTTGWMGNTRIRWNDREIMTWKELREVHSLGIRIGSHSVRHPELYALQPEDLNSEIRKSKETLEDKLGIRIGSFSYPYAFPDHDRQFVERLEVLLEACGYENGVSTIIGTAHGGDNRYFLPRLPVNSYDDLQFFQAKLERAYDWLHLPQRLYKAIRHGRWAGSRKETALGQIAQ
jgi:peptidoglycan/xylan/chitin deacetylase (PgdA/CDA1 family)